MKTMNDYCEMCDPGQSEHISVITNKGRTLWAWVGEFNLVMFTDAEDGRCDEYAELPVSFCPYCGRSSQ